MGLGPEGKIKNDIAFYLSLLRKRGALDFWYNMSTGVFDPIRKIYRRNNSAYSRNGVSDIIGVLRGGRALFIEVKSKTGRLTPDQLLFKESVERFGALFIVARSVTDVQEVLIPLIEDNLT